MHSFGCVIPAGKGATVVISGLLLCLWSEDVFFSSPTDTTACCSHLLPYVSGYNRMNGVTLAVSVKGDILCSF